MTTDAQIICRKESYGAVCQWEGGSVAELWSEVVREHVKHKHPTGEVFKYGGLKLRVLEKKESIGMPYDSYYVALANNPNAELLILYRKVAWWLLRRANNLEMRVNGFMLRLREGQELPFTSWLYRKLL